MDPDGLDFHGDGDEVSGPESPDSMAMEEEVDTEGEGVPEGYGGPDDSVVNTEEEVSQEERMEQGSISNASSPEPMESGDPQFPDADQMKAEEVPNIHSGGQEQSHSDYDEESQQSYERNPLDRAPQRTVLSETATPPDSPQYGEEQAEGDVGDPETPQGSPEPADSQNGEVGQEEDTEGPEEPQSQDNPEEAASSEEAASPQEEEQEEEQEQEQQVPVGEDYPEPKTPSEEPQSPIRDSTEDYFQQSSPQQDNTEQLQDENEDENTVEDQDNNLYNDIHSDLNGIEIDRHDLESEIKSPGKDFVEDDEIIDNEVVALKEEVSVIEESSEPMKADTQVNGPAKIQERLLSLSKTTLHHDDHGELDYDEEVIHEDGQVSVRIFIVFCGDGVYFSVITVPLKKV